VGDEQLVVEHYSRWARRAGEQATPPPGRARVSAEPPLPAWAGVGRGGPGWA
jgi:hypothetical protein